MMRDSMTKSTIFKVVCFILFLVAAVVFFGGYTGVLLKEQPNYNYQFYQKLCPDVSAHFSNKLISEFLQERRNFYLQLTDRVNDTYRTQNIGPRYPKWNPPHLFYDLLGPIAKEICPWKLEAYDKTNMKMACGMTKKKNDCVVISLGSANRFEFEEDVIKDTLCKVKVFDCTVNLTVPQHVKDRVEGFHICIGNEDKVLPVGEKFIGFDNPISGKGFQFMKWTSLLSHINLADSPEVVKMDIESSEFPVLRSIFSSLTHFPSQLLLELHFGELKSVEEALLFVHFIHDAGYVLIARADNVYCPSCTEVTYKRIFC